MRSNHRKIGSTTEYELYHNDYWIAPPSRGMTVVVAASGDEE